MLVDSVAKADLENRLIESLGKEKYNEMISNMGERTTQMRVIYEDLENTKTFQEFRDGHMNTLFSQLADMVMDEENEMDINKAMYRYYLEDLVLDHLEMKTKDA